MGIYRLALVVCCLIVVMALGTSVALAQEDSTCSALTSAAVNQASTQCAMMGTDTVCYGHPDVAASLQETAVTIPVAQQEEAALFSRPGDQMDLRYTRAIRTAGLDSVTASAASTDSSTWGVALMNVSAGLPSEVLESLDNKGVVYLLLGGVEIENAVDPAAVFEVPAQGVAVTTIADADLRLAPVVSEFNAAGRVLANTPLTADAVSPDGEWVRVVHEGRPGWLSRTVLSNIDLNSLPQKGPDSFTPMQAFNLSAAGAAANCAEVAPMLLVQGPEGVAVDLRVQGVDMRLESSVVFRLIPARNGGEDSIQVITLSGLVTLFPDTEFEVVLPPGFLTEIDSADPDSFAGRFLEAVRPLVQDEAEILGLLEEVPPNVLHYILSIPERVQASGVDALEEILFLNPEAVELARQGCAIGRISEEICDVLGL